MNSSFSYLLCAPTSPCPAYLHPVEGVLLLSFCCSLTGHLRRPSSPQTSGLFSVFPVWHGSCPPRAAAEPLEGSWSKRRRAVIVRYPPDSEEFMTKKKVK